MAFPPSGRTIFATRNALRQSEIRPAGHRVPMPQRRVSFHPFLLVFPSFHFLCCQWSKRNNLCGCPDRPRGQLRSEDFIRQGRRRYVGYFARPWALWTGTLAPKIHLHLFSDRTSRLFATCRGLYHVVHAGRRDGRLADSFSPPSLPGQQ